MHCQHCRDRHHGAPLCSHSRVGSLGACPVFGRRPGQLLLPSKNRRLFPATSRGDRLRNSGPSRVHARTNAHLLHVAGPVAWSPSGHALNGQGALRRGISNSEALPPAGVVRPEPQISLQASADAEPPSKQARRLIWTRPTPQNKPGSLFSARPSLKIKLPSLFRGAVAPRNKPLGLLREVCASQVSSGAYF